MTLVRPTVHLACLVPLAWMIGQVASGNAGANPIEYLTRGIGDWALRLLLITLAVSPAARLLKRPLLLQYRRAIGLYVFFYATCHLTTYLWFDQFFDWGEIARDIVKRPFILAGFVSFLMLVPLAATSNRFSMVRLQHRWRRLHKLIYVLACTSLLHYWWMVRADFSKAEIYLAILVALLGYRLWVYVRGLRRGVVSGAGSGP